MTKRFLFIPVAILFGLSLYLTLPPKAPSLPHTTVSSVTEKQQAATPTLQSNIQEIVAHNLQLGIATYKASSGSALLIRSKSGAALAMASYDGTAKTETLEALTAPYEPGSVMKPLLVAAALNSKAINMNYHYYDKDWDTIGEKVITNSHQYTPSERTLQDIITLSLNTGAVHILRQMGGGTINADARNIWHSYLTDHYQFGTATRTGVGTDSAGLVPSTSMPGAASRYAQTAFGIGVTVSPVQLTAAYAAITGDGSLRAVCITYQSCNQDTQPVKAVDDMVVMNIRTLLINSLKSNNPGAVHTGYVVGGKSGTAPITLPGGVYQNDVDNGTYIGFFGKETADYVLFIRLERPQIDGYASLAAAHVWAATLGALINQAAL